MNEAMPWGKCQYDLTPGNEPLHPDKLLSHLAEARANPHEIKRRAFISLELAIHPAISESDQQKYLAETNAIHDLIIKREQATKENLSYVYFTYAFLPLLAVHNKTTAKKANKIVADRCRQFAHQIEDHNTINAGAARGKAAELVVASSLRRCGFRAVPSLYRQNNSIPLVEGRRYSWDITVTKDSHDPDDTRPLFVQVKHRDFNDGKPSYHKDIFVHQVFPPSERTNNTSPKIFQFMNSALGIDNNADPAGFKKYSANLEQTLSKLF